MSLTAKGSLPLQKEKTDKKKQEPKMAFGKYMGGKQEDDKDKPSLAERTAADWIKPGGGYDQYKKGDPEREKQLPIGGTVPPDPKPMKPVKKRMSFGQRIAQKD